MEERIRDKRYLERIMTAQQAAEFVKPDMLIGTSGFTPAGYPKAVPLEIAKRAQQGEKLNLTLLTGASVGDELDGALARAGALKKRMPYQTNTDLRNAINAGEVEFCDTHLSHLPLWVKSGYLGKMDLAIIEAVAIDENGNIIPSTSVGCSNTYVECAEKVIIEINTSQPLSLEGVHDIYSPEKAPNTKPIPLLTPEDRIGTPYIACDFNKVCAVVVTDIPDKGRAVAPVDEISQQIADNLIGFLKYETKAGRLPAELPPLQSGVGSVANAVLAGLKDSDYENLMIYSEVLQDSVFDLIDAGKIRYASGTSLTISPDLRDRFYQNLDRYREKIILRPQEISNHPEVIRRLGLIAINTVIEADLYGNTNSSYVNGIRLMNGIGGSGDFAQNAGLSIFITQSTAKNGTLSCIVPFVTHPDHTEHDIHVLITEQGAADLRGLAPVPRARRIIENCAHPDFRAQLTEYLDRALAENKYRQMPHLLGEVFGGTVQAAR